ncbi:hypothetical protein TRIATDRAFT_86469 [Trichoderma atroviride IMI 206040]|uniref:Uncharacterized protein n=1 Tax=Hypocrea atroviridis (strain ATCC 20476 / IMI 206040) TaxID=452589 RepID=G9P2C3_HYPAI|nr:uncharacterized protein TRIATDRAFT_86469 [Trichoderma atroviride IMI 206040]EHK42662.1 hypothetical protein TRIATDRAFT_86469 [Trichoderma atroviride IMI 206040]
MAGGLLRPSLLSDPGARMFRRLRAAGRERNQGRSTEETPRDGHRGGAFAAWNGYAVTIDTLTSLAPLLAPTSSSWGATEGNADLKDEQADEAIAESEKKDEAENAAAEEPAESEDMLCDSWDSGYRSSVSTHGPHGRRWGCEIWLLITYGDLFCPSFPGDVRAGVPQQDKSPSTIHKQPANLDQTSIKLADCD